jgi:diguanylate cyclase (GGDEF)-like protein
MNSPRVKAALRFFALGLPLIVAVVVLRSGLLHNRGGTVQHFYYALVGAGAFLAWRFHTTRIFSLVCGLILASETLRLSLVPATAVLAFDVLAVLLPANFALFAWVEERGFTPPEVGYRAAWFALQAAIVVLICQSDRNFSRGILEHRFLTKQYLPGEKLPQIALLVFAIALIALLVRFALYRKPVESGSFWSLAAAAVALQASGAKLNTTVYFAAAVLILALSTIETSYMMAYHDELTGLPARRAFNETLKRLEGGYSIAIVDVDHFKKFNDTYGHDTGDQVLRMVASKLAGVTGGGLAFRCGGEEFAVIFPSSSAAESFEHLELLRSRIEGSSFRLRGQDRRKDSRAVDRRKGKRRTKRAASVPRRGGAETSVTVSIGVAEPGPKDSTVEQVIEAADRALYRAKDGGRNRVESDKPVFVGATRLSKVFS